MSLAARAAALCPEPEARHIDFFREHGWLVVEDAIPEADLEILDEHGERIMADKARLANDWAWDAAEDKDHRSFRIVQGFPSMTWPELKALPYRAWMTRFASALMGSDQEFWYDQFLAKPPEGSLPTYWHQDEGYWGRNLWDKGITCWVPLQDVDERNGCMHFIDGGHKHGVLPHRLVEGVQSDLLVCEVDAAKTVACPIRRGSVTFHHSKTPHMTTSNTSRDWRRAVTNHMQLVGTGGEGQVYPWRVYVNQRTGERAGPGSGHAAPKS